MSERYSFDEVLKKLEIKDFEIFQFLPQGLQPFTDQGQTPMKCPDYCHKYFQISDRDDEVSATLKVLKPVIEQIEKLNPSGDNSVTLPMMSEFIIDLLEDANMKVQKDERGVTLSYAQISYLRDLKKRYSAEKGAFWNNWEAITQDDPLAISWKYFLTPETPEMRQKLLNELRTKYFEKAQVETLKCTKTDSSLEPPTEAMKFSQDYRSINKKGKQYTLTPNQAAVIQHLNEALMNGTPDVSQSYILEYVLKSPQRRLRDAFGDRALFYELIQEGKKKGTFRMRID